MLGAPGNSAPRFGAKVDRVGPLPQHEPQNLRGHDRIAASSERRRRIDAPQTSEGASVNRARSWLQRSLYSSSVAGTAPHRPGSFKL
jgi:hypothetical protein